MTPAQRKAVVEALPDRNVLDIIRTRFDDLEARFEAERRARLAAEKRVAELEGLLLKTKPKR